ncbi:MAG: MFS transporter [Pseudomonadota bacterium]|nr:MFS transporter [Pseudomonadota bacterium]
MYASFIAIGLLTGMSFLQAYILQEHLGIPRPQQGAITGLLGLTSEAVAIPLTAYFGILADRIGRRPIFMFATGVIGISYALYPFAETTTQLILYRMIFAVGAASMGAVLATIGADYPAEQSRGKFIGASNIMNSLGVTFIASVISQIPSFLQPRGFTPIESGRVMFLTCAALSIFTLIWARIGLRPGTPTAKKQRLPFRVLVTSGIRAARNPRLAISFAAAFTARSDLALKGAFISLWAIQAGMVERINPAEAMAKVGLVFGLMQVIAIIWNVVFGYIMDRINRVTAVAIAMGLAGVGYSSMAFVSSPLDYASFPLFGLLSIGSASAIAAAVTLAGQEAPANERGAIMGVNQLCGAVGMMFAFTVGGWLFDMWWPAPFVLAGVLQIILCVVAIFIRMRAPGVGIAA